MTYFTVFGLPVANGIVASSRTDGDMPEDVWNAAKEIYQTRGWEATSAFAKKLAPDQLIYKHLERQARYLGIKV